MKLKDIVNQFPEVKNCLDFDWSGRKGNCQRYEDWQDVIHPCAVLTKGKCIKECRQ